MADVIYDIMRMVAIYTASHWQCSTQVLFNSSTKGFWLKTSARSVRKKVKSDFPWCFVFFYPFLAFGSSLMALTIRAQTEAISLSSSDLSSVQLPWQCHHQLFGKQIRGPILVAKADEVLTLTLMHLWHTSLVSLVELRCHGGGGWHQMTLDSGQPKKVTP